MTRFAQPILLLGLALSFAIPARADDPRAPRPDVQTGASGNLPPDLAEILKRAQQGIAPSPEELAKLKAWGNQARGRKQEIIQSGEQQRQTLQNATPTMPTAPRPRPPAGDGLVHGKIILDLDQIATSNGRSGTSSVHNTLSITLPVVYFVESDGLPGGKLKVTCRADGQGAPTGSATMTAHGETSNTVTDGNGTAAVTGWGPMAIANAKFFTNNTIIAEISRPAGAARPYLSTVQLPVASTGTQRTTAHHTRPPGDESGSSAMAAIPASPLTLDNLMVGIEGSVLGPAQMQSLAQYGVRSNPLQQSPEISDGLRDATFSFPADTFVAQFATGHFTAIGSYQYTLHNNASDGSHGQMLSRLRLTLTTEQRQIEAVVAPVDADGYNKWIPKGPVVPGDARDFPSKIRFAVLLRNKATQAPVTDLPFQVKYSLVNVSQQPGYCMNYPNFPLVTPDLVFLAANQPTAATVGGDGLSMTVPPEHASDPVEVTSRDYGPWGELQAQVTLVRGGRRGGGLSERRREAAVAARSA